MRSSLAWLLLCMCGHHDWRLWREPPKPGDLRICRRCGTPEQFVDGKWVPFDE